MIQRRALFLTHLDLLFDQAVFLVAGIVLVREAPLVTREHRSGFQNAVDFTVHALPERRN